MSSSIEDSKNVSKVGNVSLRKNVHKDEASKDVMRPLYKSS